MSGSLTRTKEMPDPSGSGPPAFPKIGDEPQKRADRLPDRPWRGSGCDPQVASGWRFAQLTATSSMTNEVCSDESSVPENFRVTDLPTNEVMLNDFCT